MGKKIFLAFILISLSIGSYVYYRVTKPRPSLTNAIPFVRIDAAELYRQYQANETTADSQFLDKVIEVTGVITDIQATDSTLSIELKGGESGGVNCSVTGGNKQNSLKTGTTVSIKGECSGFLLDVTLSDCVIEDKN